MAVLTFITLATIVLLMLEGNRRAAVFVAPTIASGIALSFDLVPYGSIVYSASFPSGHSMMSALVYLTLGALLAYVLLLPLLITVAADR